jgi:hypothetical protein
MDEIAASSWAPDTCALSTEERPLRQADFDDLFTATVTDIERVSSTRARFGLTGGDGLAAQVADLAERETSCCSFFVFDVERDRERIVLDVRVPPAYAEVLTALLARAEQVRS